MQHNEAITNETTSNVVLGREPSWVKNILHWCKLEDSTPVVEIHESTDALANRYAPNTRKLWRWILLLEGVAVVLPISWLMVSQRGWPASWGATLVAIFIAAMLGICWWLRWKQQQHKWTKARLIAEITRSKIATAKYGSDIIWNALNSAPALQPIAEIGSIKGLVGSELDLEELKRRYATERIEDQSTFFAKKAKEASLERQKLSRLVTRSRDVAVRAAAQTVLGASQMVIETKQHTGTLRDAVTSPGGTTIAGLEQLEENGLRNALLKAVRKATEKSEQLAKG